MDECYVLDTNVLLDYLFDYIDKNKHLQARELVKTLKKTASSIYIPNGVEFEVLKVIAESFMILRDLIILEMRKNDWDNLSVKDRLNILDRTRNDFDQLFDDIRKKFYPNTSKGIRLSIAKRVFSTLASQLIDKRLSEIRDDILTENKIKDQEEYLTEKISKKFSTFPPSVTITNSFEEYLKHTIFMREFGKVKNVGLGDLVIFYEILLAVKGRVCETLIIISNDYDLITIRESLIKNLNDFMNSSNNKEHKKYAREIRDLISSNVKVEKVNEVINKIKSSHNQQFP
ncbi:type II toxin-antitoxin system VapC family toxin [Metallosphaera tengchongensis]|uniref:Type II toxin-antitoxin system VapC family toxin n=1 Tax=Metallosphaera tengchongensis TaxID=1532350 RepID=A0A6N0NW01_9CREN|nr:type II toxin-antitoxin system VapC family toxin [Metallosphaera tengchongensis]